jgi:AcrR family transcriptional regulator
MFSQDTRAALSPGLRRERIERERLFAATIEEAREHGCGYSSVAQVAARAGLSQSRFEAHFAGVEQCLLQALHSLALQAHAHVLCAYYAPREDALHPPPAAGAEQLLERVLACLVPIAAATGGARPSAPTADARLPLGGGALRESLHRKPPNGL